MIYIYCIEFSRFLNLNNQLLRYQSSEAGYGTQSETYSAPSEISSGRHSRASSSSSSGCMSDGAPSSCENAFDSEFPMGKIYKTFKEYFL